MLVFLSDSHLTHRFADFGAHSYLSGRSVRVFLENLKALLNRRNTDYQRIKEIKIVLLGDIFDFIRTSHWWVDVGEEKEVTPWNPKDFSKLESEVKYILNNILKDNASRSFVEELKKAKEELSKDYSVETLYFVGNHDRMLAVFPSLQKIVKDVLSVDKFIFEPYFFEDYLTLACHGHEFDMVNRENKGLPPIGDFISSITTIFPIWFLKRIKEKNVKGLSDAQLKKIKDGFGGIDDVRPASAALPWIARALKTGDEKLDKRLRKILKNFVFELLKKLRKNDFLRRWLKIHDKKLWIINKLISFFGFTPFGNLIAKKLFSFDKLMDKLIFASGDKDKDKKDRYEVEAYKLAQNGANIIVMGHTHKRKLSPLAKGKIYINTGTWRRLFHITYDKNSFSPVQHLTFAVVYGKKDETTHVFELWDATMTKKISSI